MEGKIHPVIIYPFTDPYDASDRDRTRFGRRDVVCLYEGLQALIDQAPRNYETPKTVINRQTINRSKHLRRFIDDYIKLHSTIIQAWCVDSCQMWLTGLGTAFDEEITTRDTQGDIFWLIPGDYKYSSYSHNHHNRSIFTEMVKLPNTIAEERHYHLCIGEINVGANNSKQLIDTYGTYGLLANWFPDQARQIRQLTSKPRTEFFAISRSFLREVLDERWYAYEQTIVMLLRCYIGGRKPLKVSLGEISDSAQGRDSLAVAMQQLERTERVLKLFWREQHQKEAQWVDRFRKLDSQSEQIRGAALVILENLF